MDSSDDANSPDMFDTILNRPRPNNGQVREGLSSSVGNSPVVSNKSEDEETNSPWKVNFPIVRLPKVAVKEHIILCIENSQDKGLGYTFSDLDKNTKEPHPLSIRNEALRMFMVNKLAIAKDTEFSIVSLESGKLNRLSPLTSNISILSKSLREYRYISNEETNNILDISPIFSDLPKLFDIPESSNNVTLIPPNHIVRVIFVYSNSFRAPQLNINDPSYLKLLLSPFFFLDVFYLHEKQSDFNLVDRIYKELGKIVSPTSYLLESSRDVTKVFNNTMKLLAHPYQRVLETVWNF